MAYVANLDGVPLPPQPWNETHEFFKERVSDEGNWSGFLADKAMYRFLGLPREWANRFAMRHYPPPQFLVKHIQTGVTPSECGLGSGLPEAKMRERLMQRLGLEEHIHSSEFEDKTCSFSEAVDWVAENLAIHVVCQQAPSKMAWSIYQWAGSHPTYRADFYRMYLTRRYRPEKAEDDYFDPTEGLSMEREDIGVRVPGQSVVPDALPADSDRPAREREVAEDDELASFTIGERAEASS